MQITIDTNELSDLDRQVMGLLAGGTFILGGEPQEFEEQVEEPAPKPAAKKATAKKAKPVADEPDPEPMAEEPLKEDPAEEEVDADEESDEDLLALAVKKATEMVAGGEAAQVREALDAAGASRVRELNKDNVREFFKALS